MSAQRWVPATNCAWCGRHNPLVTKVGGDGLPSDGDVSMCIACGRFELFVAGPLGLGVKRPTPEEQAVIDADERVQKLRQAWQATR